MPFNKNLYFLTSTIGTFLQKVFLSFILFFIFSRHALSQPADTFPNPIPQVTTLRDFFHRILEIIVNVGLPLAVVFLILSGFLFVSAQGNETKLATAKKAFIWSVVGMAVILGAWTLSIAIEGTVNKLK